MRKNICSAAALFFYFITYGQEIKLSQPKVNHSLVMLTGTPVSLEFDFRMQGAEIKYTSDGSEPTIASLTYKNKLSILKSSTIKARVFHPDYLPSDKVVSIFVCQGKKIATISVNSPNEKYKGNGSKSLHDNIFGDMDFKNNYLGYNDDAMMAEIFPSKASTLSKVNVSYLVNQGSWIFGPLSIKVSDIKGNTIGEQILTETDVKKTTDHIIHSLSIKKIKYKYLKITVEPLKAIPDWHEGKGNKAWLFVDELWVE